jgi:hypothetical protein
MLVTRDTAVASTHALRLLDFPVTDGVLPKRRSPASNTGLRTHMQNHLVRAQ